MYAYNIPQHNIGHIVMITSIIYMHFFPSFGLKLNRKFDQGIGSHNKNILHPYVNATFMYVSIHTYIHFILYYILFSLILFWNWCKIYYQPFFLLESVLHLCRFLLTLRFVLVLESEHQPNIIWFLSL